MVSRPARRRRLDAFEAEIGQIEPVDKGIHHTNGIALLDPLIEDAGNSVDCPRSASSTKRFINCPRQIARRIMADNSFSRGQGHLQPSADVMPMSALASSKADIGLHSTTSPDVTFFVVATSNPFHSLLSPTTRRSILLIRSERSASAALIAAIVCCKVLTFDPSDTIPPSTTAIDPIAAT